MLLEFLDVSSDMHENFNARYLFPEKSNPSPSLRLDVLVSS